MGLLLLVGLSVYFLMREARALKITFLTRSCFRALSLREGFKYAGLFLLVGVLSVGAAQTLVPLLDWIRFDVPDYLPFFLNPRLDPATTDLDALQTAPFSIEKKSAGFVVRIREQLDKPGATALQQALEDLNFSGNLQITLQFPDKVGYSPSISARIYSAVKKLQRSGIKVSIQTADAAFKAHLQM
ncbi:MAG: hypothetical protein IID13_10775 [Candidatus Marinimicrobia bacterium]|nr:hypothetical protein [Candidatus Neomarinimicrobiota bacterium]